MGFERRILALLSLAFILSAYAEAASTSMYERLTAVVRRHVVETGSWSAEELDVRVLAFTPASVKFPPGNMQVVRPLTGIRPGIQSFLVAFTGGEQQQVRVWVKASIRIFEDVVVCSQPLLLNEAVTLSQIRLERRDVSHVNGRPFLRLNDVVGQQVTRAIAANEILTHRNIARPTLIARGSPVTLVYESGALHVEAAGVVEESGRAGDFVQVKNSGSGKLLRGKVLDARTIGIR
jgi:flagella basal body P-ring formation protein FlgA